MKKYYYMIILLLIGLSMFSCKGNNDICLKGHYELRNVYNHSIKRWEIRHVYQCDKFISEDSLVEFYNKNNK